VSCLHRIRLDGHASFEPKAADVGGVLDLRTFEKTPDKVRLTGHTDYPGSVPTRSSARRFSAGRLTFEQVSRLLGVLRRYPVDGKFKYAYASAGALYPVHTYIHTRDSQNYGVEGLHAAAYYYHPAEHELYAISMNPRWDRNSHAPINRPVFDQAALMIFLVADLSAITPVYGDEAFRMACIEAGLMAQLLEQHAGILGMGIGHIGYPVNDAYRSVLDLTASHALLHTLLAGCSQRDS
jgi:SagB-type dehydrogenase family enzyme